MKMQIWKIWIAESPMDAIHGFYKHIYEAYVPDFKLAINYLTYFTLKTDSYPKERSAEKEAELVAEIDLTPVQIEYCSQMADATDPHSVMRSAICNLLNEKDLDSSDYGGNEDEDLEEPDYFDNGVD